MRTDGTARRWLAVPLAAAIAAGLLTIDGGFLFDDRPAVVKNVVVNGGRPVAEAFIRDHWGNPVRQGATNYRPLSPTMWRLMWLAGSGTPLPFRITSVLFHVAAVAAAWWLARRVGAGIFVATVGAMLFALHPLRSEAVGSIVGQSDVLSTALGFVAIGLALGKDARRNGMLAGGVLVLACLVKESAVALGLALLVAVVAQRRDVLARAVPSGIVLAAVAAVQAALPRATGYQHALNNLGYAAEGWEQWLLGLNVVGRSVGLCFVPLGLSPHHGYATVALGTEVLAPAAIGGVLLTVAGATLGVIAIRRGRVDAALVLALLFAPAFMQSGLLVTIGTDLAERLLYPATAATAFLVVFGVARYARRSWLRWAAVATLAVAAGVGSWRAQRPWRSASALWSHTAEAQPLSLRARVNMSQIEARRGNPARAAWHGLVATHLQRHIPEPVDRAAIERIEGMYPQERVLFGPRLLSEAPCPLIRAYLQHSTVVHPEVRALTARLWTEPYKRCLQDL